jgi:hypothetical protein
LLASCRLCTMRIRFGPSRSRDSDSLMLLRGDLPMTSDNSPKHGLPRAEDSSDAEMRETCAILESIAEEYPVGSDEEQANRNAALAYIAVHLHENLKKAYQKLVRASGGELSEETKADLRRHGIDPDSLEGEDSIC